jgi:3'-phosphoadenosine 5'-phosphosulfate sulfotransferase (PAPS reductase)/FAD synthetase
VFANDRRFNRGGRFLMITGERRQESAARSRYAEIERDRSATQKRNVLRWRAVIDYTETEVWELIERHGIEPHPAYVLGFGRVSCAACIFGNRDQWATVRELFPERFETIAAYEDRWGLTIKRTESVREQAERGTSFVAGRTEAQKATGQSRSFTLPIQPERWTLPAGAFAECGGPS